MIVVNHLRVRGEGQPLPCVFSFTLASLDDGFPGGGHNELAHCQASTTSSRKGLMKQGRQIYSETSANEATTHSLLFLKATRRQLQAAFCTIYIYLLFLVISSVLYLLKVPSSLFLLFLVISSALYLL